MLQTIEKLCQIIELLIEEIKDENIAAEVRQAYKTAMGEEDI